MRAFAIFMTILGWLALTGTAQAAGRYERGRSLYWQHCQSCFKSGWQWQPLRLSAEQSAALRKALPRMAKEWSPYQICTWQRRQAKPMRLSGKPIKCRVPRLPVRDKTAVLYYLSRRLGPPIVKPRLRAITAPKAKGFKFNKRTPALRQRALERQRAWEAKRRFRERARFQRRPRLVVPKRPAKSAKPRRGRR